VPILIVKFSHHHIQFPLQNGGRIERNTRAVIQCHKVQSAGVTSPSVHIVPIRTQSNLSFGCQRSEEEQTLAEWPAMVLTFCSYGGREEQIVKDE
jgi:hypothetical protein